MAVRRFLWAFFCLAVSGSAQQYAFVPVRAPNAPQNVHAMLQDRVGRLWVGTGTGVESFDGARFIGLEKFGLPEAEVDSVAADDSGGIWIASKLGLYRFHGGELDLVREGAAVSVIRVVPDVMLADFDPLGKETNGTLFRFVRQESGWKAELLAGVQAKGPLSMGHVSIGHDRSLTFGGPRSWFEISPQALAGWRSGTPVPVIEHALINGNVEQVFRDAEGCVWVRNQGTTAYQCPGDRSPRELPSAVTDGQKLMSEAWDGRILLPGTVNFAIGRPGAFQVARPANGLPPMECALMADDGTLWLGGAKGLFRFAFPFALEFWNERDGLSSVFSTLHLNDRIFAGDSEGIKELSRDRRSWSVLPKLPGLGPVYHILAGPSHSILAALYMHGVEEVALDGSTVNRPGRFAPGMHLAWTRDGALWVAGFGVSRVKMANGIANLTQEPLPGDHSNGLDIETNPTNGDLWACYDGGLIEKLPSGWQRITEKEGLLQNGCRSIAVTGSGDVWFGYNSIEAFSLVRPRAHATPQIRHFRSGGEIGNAAVHFLSADGRGWLWRGAGDGVYVADSTLAESGIWRHLGEAEGLPALDTNQQGFYADPDGSVWIGADNSLIHFRPPSDLLVARNARAFVSAVSWDGGAAQLADSAQLVPHGAKLTIHIGVPGSDRHDALRLRYRILPEQTDWTSTASPDITPETVSAGSHTFEVQARAGSGVWSDRSSWRFRVQRPIWLSPPLLSAGIGVTVVSLFFAMRQRRKRKRRERLALPDLTDLRIAALVPEVQMLIGTALDGRFLPRRFLARGGFANVFEGRDQLEGRRCAIKVFHRELADAGLLRRFRQEVSALETILHPNVVRLFGHGTAPSGAPYLAMEFVEGATVRECLPPEGFEPRRAGRLLRQLGSALDALHGHEIFHRDLKPENLMLRSAGEPDEQVVLIDFSIAIVQDTDESIHGLSRAAGTFQYMAPEQAVGFACAASDVYSLARVAVEMMSGRRLSELLPNASLDLPLRVRDLLATFSLPLSQATIETIAAALEFDPTRRPVSAGLLASRVAADLGCP